MPPSPFLYRPSLRDFLQQLTDLLTLLQTPDGQVALQQVADALKTLLNELP